MTDMPLDQVPVSPSLWEDARCSDPLRSRLEQAVLQAIAENVAHAGSRARMDEALASYVACLRAQGAPPEVMIICIKRILLRSAIVNLPFKLAATLQAEMISRCIVTYYDTPPVTRR
jgi:hypothetical protein